MSLIDTPASNRTVPLSFDFYVEAHATFHFRKNNEKIMLEKPYQISLPFSFYRGENSG